MSATKVPHGEQTQHQGAFRYWCPPGVVIFESCIERAAWFGWGVSALADDESRRDAAGGQRPLRLGFSSEGAAARRLGAAGG